MNKRHCFVTDVGDAIEKLADALDHERTKPFGGDILDLLEWASRDVLAAQQQFDAANALINKYREETTSLRQQLADTEEKRADLEFVWNACEQELESCKSERDEARQQLADNDLFELDRNKWRNNYRAEIAKLTEQVTLLRDVLKFYMDNGICEPFYHRVAEALATTKEQ